MRRGRMQIVIGMVALTLTFGTTKTEVCAENDDVSINYTTEETVITGKFGENDGFLWEYDESTKTLNVTGEDSGLNELKTAIPTNVTENVVNIIFEDCKVNGSLEGLLFQLSTVESVEFKEFDTQNVTNMMAVFSNCTSLKKLDVSSFDTSNVTTMMGMFEGCNSMTELNISGWNTEKVTNMFGMFAGCNSLKNLNVSDLDTENVTDMDYMFAICSELTDLDLSNFNTQNVTSMSAMFTECKKLSSLDLSNFKTENVSDMSWMFCNCLQLTDLDVSSFDTSNVTTMYWMFSNCDALTSLDVSGFDTSNVTTMYRMFAECRCLTDLDVSGFDTGNVTDFAVMFFRCFNLTDLDVSNFDTEKATDMQGMFSGCNKLTELDLSSFDTKNVTDMNGMFSYCNNLTDLNLSTFNTQNVTNMWNMFAGCGSLISLDISSFDTTSVEDFSGMLDSCSTLSRIYTSKVMAAGQKIDLPDTFYDSVNNSVTALASESCSKVLQKEWSYYNITYYLDEGTNDISNPLKYNAEFEVIILKEPTKDGYTFDGWYADSEFKTRVTEIVKGSTGDKEFYAKWVEIMTPEKQVKAFVERMYTVALGRAADPQGVAFWTEQLLSHQADGAGLAQGFILSDEFVEKNYSDTDYVKVLYKTFFNREADEGGIAFWISEMNGGKTGTTVLAGFVNSNEFDELCTGYGIERGTMVVEPTEPVPTPEPDSTPESGIQGFVERLYVIALERPSEASGLEDWTRRIEAGENSPQDVAKFFFLSAEYAEKGTSNDKYIEALYLVFMDRASEPGGKAYWVSELEKGTGREAALEGFAQSQEFQEIMYRYGL